MHCGSKLIFKLTEVASLLSVSLLQVNTFSLTTTKNMVWYNKRIIWPVQLVLHSVCSVSTVCHCLLVRIVQSGLKTPVFLLQLLTV